MNRYCKHRACLLRKIRNDRDINQRQLADSIGVCYQYISQQERSLQSMPLSKWKQLSLIQGVDSVEIIEAHMKDYLEELEAGLL